MAKHRLSLEVLPTKNCDILRLEDSSVYADNLPVDCPTLNITTPGSNYSIELDDNVFEPGFRNLNLTACVLELQTTGCGTEFRCLPDGIYVLKYSVSPNDQVYVEYNHLRVCKLRNRYDKILCDLDIADCEPDAETQKKLDLLKKIDMYIKAAVAKVEECHEAKKGMQLYTYAKKLLDKFTCTSC